MIARVFTGLKAAGLDLDSEDLADTLWLAACGLFPARSSEIAPGVSPEKPPPEIPKHATPVPANPAPISAPPPAPVKSKTDTTVETEDEGAAELVAPGLRRGNAEGGKTRLSPGGDRWRCRRILSE